MTRYSPTPRQAYPPHRGRAWRCSEKGCEDFPDCPMLKNEVWADIAGPKDLLCIKHTEFRLGRPLVVDDLEDCMANMFTFLLHDRAVEAAAIEYKKCQDAVAEHSSRSSAQAAERRARDHCLNIKERIEKL